jgi:hypothetical protein
MEWSSCQTLCKVLITIINKATNNGKNTQNNGKPMTAVASRRMNHT